MRRWLPWVGTILIVGCSSPRIMGSETDAGGTVDNEEAQRSSGLSVEGTVCTVKPPEQVTPVSIVMVLDRSQSTAITDAAERWPRAIADVVARYDADPRYRFAIVAFGDTVSVNGGLPGTARLTRDQQELKHAIDGLATHSGMADLQGALEVVRQLLDDDWRGYAPSTRKAHRYVVHVIADGLPGPVCDGDCEGGDPSLTRNTPASLLSAIGRLMRSASELGVGKLQVHTHFDPGDSPTGEQQNGGQLLQSLAIRGAGTFTIHTTSGSISLVGEQHAPLDPPFTFGLQALFGVYQGLAWFDGRWLPDQDGDGLADELERNDPALDPTRVDADGDGYGDLVAYRVGVLPGSSCADPFDADGDGLSECEELAIGTESVLSDTDGDGVPDGLELAHGTDPLTADGAAATIAKRFALRSSLVEQGVGDDGGLCYGARLDNVVAATEPRRIAVYLAEGFGPEAKVQLSLRVACVSTAGITASDPNPTVTLSADEFRPLREQRRESGSTGVDICP